MSLHLWLSLIGICFLGAASPGPSLVVILRIALRNGTREGLLAAWSHAGAIGLYAVLSLLFFTSARAIGGPWFWLVAAAGQVWLLYLGSQMLRAALAPGTTGTDNTRPPEQADRWYQGLIIGLFNPKIWLFFTAVFSPFVSAMQAPIGLALVPFLIDGLWYSMIVAGVTRGGLAHHLQRLRRPMDGMLGGALLTLGLLALSESLPRLLQAISGV